MGKITWTNSDHLRIECEEKLKNCIRLESRFVEMGLINLLMGSYTELEPDLGFLALLAFEGSARTRA
jgi:hypothetical protein